MPLVTYAGVTMAFSSFNTSFHQGGKPSIVRVSLLAWNEIPGSWKGNHPMADSIHK